MSLETLVGLFEFDGVERRNRLAQSLGPAFRTLSDDGLLIQGREMRFEECRNCSEWHDVVEQPSGWALDCPELGRMPLPTFDPIGLKISPERFAETVFRTTTNLPTATARPRVPDLVWEAWLEGGPLARPLFLARQVGELSALQALTSEIRRIPNRKTATVIVSAATKGIATTLAPATVVEMNRVLEFSTSGSFVPVSSERPLSLTAKRPPGRPDKCKRALEIHRERVAAGTALKSNAAEAHELLLLLPESDEPEEDLPDHKTLVNRLSKERATSRKS